MLIVCCFILSSTITKAQEAKKYDNPQWKTIVYIDFEVGKQGRAQEIIKDYFVKAADKAGTPKPEYVLNMNSGEWDMILIWNMEDGIESMNWETSPNGVKWQKAFNEVCGGEEKAKAISSEYDAGVARAYSDVGRKR